MTDFVDILLATLGSDLVLIGEDIPQAHCHDWAHLPDIRPLAVVRPRTVEQVSATLKLCHEHEVPVVPQGGLTGLSGAAHPCEKGIALSLDRMNRITEVDRNAQTLSAETGAILAIAQKAAKDEDMMLAIDIGSRGTCQLGGLIATNAGGHNVVRYGMTREQVLGLQVVLADGTIVDDMNTMVKNNAGLDLKHLFIGSEGLLGVITACVLRLHAATPQRNTALVGCSDANAAVTLLSHARRQLGPMLSSFEVMWDNFYHTMASRCDVPTPLGLSHCVYVIVEATGGSTADTGTALETFLSEALEEELIENAILANSIADEHDIWAVRESPAEFTKVIGPIIPFDVSVPTSRIANSVTDIERAIKARWPDALALFFGHIGDNNVHLVVNIPSAGDRQPEKEIKAVVYDLVRTAGGTVSAEHGIGAIKRDYLQYSRSDTQIAMMQSIKNVLDPRGILNPKKSFDQLLDL